MNAAHTSGPWSAQRDPGAIMADDWCIGAQGQIDLVAVCSERDAQLIAAAPDMLTALIVAREFISFERNAFADTCTGPSGDIEPDDAAELGDFDAALLQINAAIQKAGAA